MKLRNKVRVVILVLISIIAIVSTSCTTVVPFFTETVPSFMEDITGDIIPQKSGHTINLGPEMNLGSQTVATSGGMVSINRPDDPLDGFQIDVPSGAYDGARTFDISYAPIIGHDYDENFNPISPMIIVENGGEYAEELMLVTIPVDIPDDSFAMAFYFDTDAGKLEGVPLVDETPDSITVATRHFTNLLVSAVNKNVLSQDIDSGFRPGVDDWQFVNWGSFIAPKGHCAGQALSAMWYYCERGTPPLSGLYDNNGGEKTSELWQDDSWGYRLASTVQKSINWDSFENKLVENLAGVDDDLTYKAFAYSMLLTGEPQEVGIFNTAVGGGHDMVCYRVKDNTLYIADPNYPGNLDRKIEFVGGSFKPYNSGANAAEIAAGRGKAYDKIAYCAKSATIDWNMVGECWAELDNGTIGNSHFPAYDIKVKGDDGTVLAYTDGFKTESEAVWFLIESNVPGTKLNCWVWEDGHRLEPGANGYELSIGRNRLGLEIAGETPRNGWKYVDFIYVDVYTADLFIEPAALEGEPGENYTFSARSDKMPANALFEWDFGDGSPGEETTANQVSYQFTESGRYTISLAVYNEDTGELFDRATSVVSIMPESKDLLSIMQNFTTFRFAFNSDNTYQDWRVGQGESTSTDNGGISIPQYGVGDGTMPITWNGTSFTGTLPHGDPDDRGRLDEVSGTVSPDGTMVENIIYSYRLRDYGTNWSSTETINLEIANIPLIWRTGSEDRQSELKCELHGSEVQSHVTLVEIYEETVRNGELEKTREYVSTDWSQEMSLYVTFRK